MKFKIDFNKALEEIRAQGAISPETDIIEEEISDGPGAGGDKPGGKISLNLDAALNEVRKENKNKPKEQPKVDTADTGVFNAYEYVQDKNKKYEDAPKGFGDLKSAEQNTGDQEAISIDGKNIPIMELVERGLPEEFIKTLKKYSEEVSPLGAPDINKPIKTGTKAIPKLETDIIKELSKHDPVTSVNGKTNPPEKFMDAIVVNQPERGIPQSFNSMTVKDFLTNYAPEDAAYLLDQVIKDKTLDEGVRQRIEKEKENYVPTFGDYAYSVGKGFADMYLNMGKAFGVIDSYLPITAFSLPFADNEVPADHPYYKASEKIQEIMEMNYPTKTGIQDQFGIKLANGLGSMGAFMSMVYITGGSGVPVWLSTGLMGGLSQAGSGYDEAWKMTGNQRASLLSFAGNFLAGTTEAVPLERFFGKLRNGEMARNLIGNMIMQGTVEGTQEAVQQLISNWTAKEFYDASRSLFLGVGEGAEIGAILGMIMPVVGAVSQKYLNNPNSSPEDIMYAQKMKEEVAEFVNNEVKDLSTALNEKLNQELAKDEEIKQVQDEFRGQFKKEETAPEELNPEEIAKEFRGQFEKERIFIPDIKIGQEVKTIYGVEGKVVEVLSDAVIIDTKGDGKGDYESGFEDLVGYGNEKPSSSTALMPYKKDPLTYGIEDNKSSSKDIKQKKPRNLTPEQEKEMQFLKGLAKKIDKQEQTKNLIQENLELIDDMEVSPRKIAEVFWDEVYDVLPENVKKNIHINITDTYGFKPGQLLGNGPGGIEIIPKDWKELGKELAKEYPGETMEQWKMHSTDKPIIALMVEAIKRYQGQHKNSDEVIESSQESGNIVITEESVPKSEFGNEGVVEGDNLQEPPITMDDGKDLAMPSPTGINGIKAKNRAKIKNSGNPSLNYADKLTLNDLMENREYQKIAAEEQIDNPETEEHSPENVDEKPFKVTERVKQVLESIGVKAREKTLNKKYRGLYKRVPEVVRTQSLLDIIAASHEGAHHIDIKNKLLDKLVEKVAKQDIKANAVAYDVVDMYVNHYLPLDREMYSSLYKKFRGDKDSMNNWVRHNYVRNVPTLREGLATAVQKYFENPGGVFQSHPNFVREFIMPDGEYYVPETTKLLDGLNQIVDDYAKLSSEEKIGSRIARGEEVTKRDTGFTRWQRIKFEIFNYHEPLERIAELTGVRYSSQDPSVWGFLRQIKNHFATQAIEGAGVHVIFKDGNIKNYKVSMKDYLKEVRGKEKEFDTFLVARRVLADYDNLFKAKNVIGEVREMLEKEFNIKVSDFDEETGAIKDFNVIARELHQEFEDYLGDLRDAMPTKVSEDIEDQFNDYYNAEKIVKNDQFRFQDAQAVVDKYERQFGKATQMYDKINRALVVQLREAGYIDHATALLFLKERGYASFQRFVNDDLGNEAVKQWGQNAQTNIRALKGRKGSSLDIISPTLSQAATAAEYIGKSLENMMWLQIYELTQKKNEDGSTKHLELARRFEQVETEEPTIDPKTGKERYYQDNDPKLLKVMKDGQRLFFKIAPELIAYKELLKGRERNVFVHLMSLPSSIFSRLTTSGNPLFALGNAPVDQIAAAIQTKTGQKIGLDAGKSFVKFISSLTINRSKGDKLPRLSLNDEKLFTQYLQKGGNRQTLSKVYDIPPENLAGEILKDSKWRKMGKIVEAPMSVMEFPSNLSEWMPRFSEYARAKQQGKTDAEALYLANEVTVPFTKHGRWGNPYISELIRGAIPFFNAVVQGNYKFFETARQNPARVAGATGLILSTSLSLAIYAMLAATDEQRRQINETPARELARAIFIPNPSGSGLIRIRIPEQIGSLTGLAYLFVAGYYDGRNGKLRNKASLEEYVEVFTAFLPQQVNLTDPVKAILSSMPKHLSIFAEPIANYKIYPELGPVEPEWMKNKPPEKRYTDWTSETAKFFGSLLGMSPMKIDHFINASLGGVGRIGTSTIDAILGKGFRVSNPIYRNETDYIAKGRAFNRFYDGREFITQQYDELKYEEKLSEEERKYVIEQMILYDEIHNTVDNMRDVLNKNKDLPEDVKEDSYQLMIMMDIHEDKDKIMDKLIPLNDRVNALLKENNMDNKPNLFSKEKFADSYDTRLKNVMKELEKKK